MKFGLSISGRPAVVVRFAEVVLFTGAENAVPNKQNQTRMRRNIWLELLVNMITRINDIEVDGRAQFYTV